MEAVTEEAAEPLVPVADCGPSEENTAGWAARLLVALADLPPPPKRVLVGSERRMPLLGQTLAPGRSTTTGGPLTIVDAHRVDGQLMEHLHRERPDEVYFDFGTEIDEHQVTRAAARLLAAGVGVHFVLPQMGRPPVHARVTRVGNHDVLSLGTMTDGPSGRVARRVLDIVGGAVLLLVLSPLLAMVALAVWWTMGRPLIHVQERVGRAGRLFRLYKFRSMVRGAEELLRASPDAYRRYVDSGFKVPVDEDQRITPLGRFLRRTSLDELPQLWNVLRGDMSLVGPRAVVPEEVAEYGDYSGTLLRVKPGLTGLWQVSGRSTIGYPERAGIDLQYVHGRSLRRDLYILLRTLPAVLRQRGAL